MDETIAFIGGGHMAASLIGGLLAAGHAASRLRVAVRSQERASQVSQRFGVACLTGIEPVIDGADVIVIAVKPQQFVAAAKGWKPAAGSTVLSVMAGIRCGVLARLLGARAEIVRAMPNTPALLRAGISGAYTAPATSGRARERAEFILDSVGRTVWVDSEDDLDAVTAVSGCGPAYFFRLVESLRGAGARLGLAPEAAAALALQTLIGSAALAAGEVDVAELRRQVTSKGGATEAALEHLDRGGFDALMRDALEAARERSRERGLAAEREIR